MTTLWDLVSQPLTFTSRNSNWGNSTSVTALGSNVLDTPENRRPERCVYDGRLLTALENSVKGALAPLHVGNDFVFRYNIVQEGYDEVNPYGTTLSSEMEVRTFLRTNWLHRAERILRQFMMMKGLDGVFNYRDEDPGADLQPDLRGQVDTGDDGITTSLIELKGEGIMRNFSKNILDCGRRQTKLNWTMTGGLDTTDLILLKVASYLAHSRLTWLCLTAVSHLIVFRLVYTPGGSYLVISDVVQVDDSREPFENPMDNRIGERWMTSVVGCALAGMAEHSNGKFDFDVNNSAMMIGSPGLTPYEIKQQFSEQYKTPSPPDNSDDDPTWTPTTKGGRARVTALLAFGSEDIPCGLAAPLVDDSLGFDRIGDTWHPDGEKEDLPYEIWNREFALSSKIPILALGAELGTGSTGIVHTASWNGEPVAVKIAQSVNQRQRLHSECGLYGLLSKREAMKSVLPTFFGRYRHKLFDVLVMSNEGSALRSFDDLEEHERENLFSMVLALHQEGVSHGDLEPRNVLRSRRGELKLIDLTEAKNHKCIANMEAEVPRFQKRSRTSRLCPELMCLRGKLGLDGTKQKRTLVAISRRGGREMIAC